MFSLRLSLGLFPSGIDPNDILKTGGGWEVEGLEYGIREEKPTVDGDPTLSSSIAQMCWACCHAAQIVLTGAMMPAYF